MDETKLWKDSPKDNNGWSYESQVGVDFMKAMGSLAYEMKINNRR